MELKIRKNGEIYIIDVNGEMDLYNSYKLKELVMKMLEKNVKNFILFFVGIYNFFKMDSAMVYWFLHLINKNPKVTPIVSLRFCVIIPHSKRIFVFCKAAKICITFFWLRIEVLICYFFPVYN